MMQGDAYSVPVTITAQDGTVITPDMVTCVEITIGNLSRKYPGAVTFDEDTGTWQFPLTQQQTFRLSQGKQETQARVVFASGDVFGGRGDTVFVTGSLSKGVLPQPEKETAGIVAPSISQVRLGNAGKIRATVGSAKVVLTSSLPPISDATKGQYLTNDGTEASWADVDALPAMSGDTAGKMLTNDGKNPEWGGAVRYDVAQTLTDANRQMGRSNIGAFPGKTLQYFFDTTTGATHDNDIFAAHTYDVIFPGNTYSDGTHSNAGMKFPAYVMSYEFITERYVQIRLLDGNGAVWNVIKSSHTLFDCSKIVEKQVMCVNFTQGDDGNWSADKNWDDAAALIKSGGLVYTNISISVCFGAFFVDGTIRFMVQPVSPGGIDVIIYDWKQNGKIDYIYKIIPVLKSDDPVVRYDEQTLTADEQAQARKNIGAGDNTLGITGARVGQIAKITAVDASGVPTAWSPVDMAGGDKWEKLIDTSLAESVESVTYTFDDCKRTKALIAPALASDEFYSGWTRISINNVSYPLFNSRVDAIKGIYFAVDSVYPPYVQASLGTNSKTSTHGFIGGIQTTALENIAPNGITELGCQTAGLLKAGTKIEIWGVKS